MQRTRRNPWVSLDASADPVDLARRLQLAHSTVVGHEGRVPAEVRPVVLDSWRRTTRSGLRPEGHAPSVVIAEDDVDAVRRAHPLAVALPAIHQAVGRIAQDAGHLLVVTDATGTLLWAEGHAAIKDAAWQLGFFEGARWSEELVGTNAIGTALAIDHPVQIFSGEHFVRTHHPWVCSGAPIHDPETGAQLGVIDLSGPLRTAHPVILGFVTTAARMAEHLLAERMHRRDRALHEALLDAVGDGGGPRAVLSPSGRVVASWPSGWLRGRVPAPAGEGACVLPDGTTGELEAVGPDAGFLLRAPGPAAGPAGVAIDPPDPAPGPPAARRATLSVLHDGPPTLAWPGAEHVLPPRHAEILTLLALHPAGMTGEALTAALYGPDGNPVTVRAELSRLRRTLGDRLLTRPYRLGVGVASDVAAVVRAVRAGRTADALRLAAAPLLEGSSAPGIVAARDEITGALRRAARTAEDPEVPLAWTTTVAGRDDVVALERLRTLLPPGDPRRATAAARLERLRGPD